MVQIQISLSDKAGKFIQEQVSAGRYPSPDHLIGELVEQACEMANDERLAELIREGLESGDGEEIDDAWWDRIEARVSEEMRRRQSA